MKRFYLIAALIISLFFASCASAKGVSQVLEDDGVAYVLYNYHPDLYEYYVEGVLRVNSIRETTRIDGSLGYKVDYDFIRYYYIDYTERAEAIRLHYPNLYDEYITGRIVIDYLFKYVDKNDGRIRHTISYHWPYTRRYNYYPYLSGRIYRHTPPPPRKPRVEPNRRPPHKPEARPHNNPPSHHGNPGVKPNNPPRTQPGGNVSGPNNPPRQQHSNPPARSQGSMHSSPSRPSGGGPVRSGGTNSRRR